MTPEKMTPEKIKGRINELCTLFGFEYNGKIGNVDPYSRNRFLLFYDGVDQVVTDIDSVMSTPFIDGKSLNEVYDKITITEW